MKSAITLAFIGLIFGVIALLNQPYAATPLVEDPHALDEIPLDCGTGVNIREAELKGMNCSDLDDKYVGGYSLIRDAGSCEWKPLVPDLLPGRPYGCDTAINAQGKPLTDFAIDGRTDEGN